MSGLIPWEKNKNKSLRGYSPFDWVDSFFSDMMPMQSGFSLDTFRLDVKENEKEYVVEAELPGIKKDEVSVSLNEGQLTISVNRDENKDEKKDNYIHRERRMGTMRRSVYLCGAISKGASAKFNDGVLLLTVPKDNESSDTKIDIQ